MFLIPSKMYLKYFRWDLLVKYAKDMPEICQKYAQICILYAVICHKYAIICFKYARNMQIYRLY